jgi:hypothetical protein
LSKTLDTIVDDLYEVLEKPPEVSEEGYADLGQRLAASVRHSFVRESEPTLRMSNIGKPCERQLWYSINEPQKAEKLTGPQYMKFLFGHLIEELTLWFAELAGHRVEGRQDEQEIAGIKGHRDVVLDGVTVDAKSASTYSFKKFKKGLTKEDDSFGYRDQLQSYIHTGKDDPIVTDKEKGAFLVIDKTLGNICLDIHEKEDFPIEAVYERKKKLIADPEPPARGFDPEPMGKSGNMKLGVNCSYCDFKKHCHPGLRTFLYSYGPVHLVEVKKEPDVLEITDETVSDSTAE